MKKILMTLTIAFAAMIAIPTAANAQDAKPEQKKECCKEKKECTKDEKAACKEGKACAKETGKTCCKEGKACAKETGKPCCKDGKKGKHKAKSDKFAKGDRRMGAPKGQRMMHRGDGENPMFKGITLSEDQKTKLMALREKKITAEKKSKADLKAKGKDDIQKLNAEFDKDVEKILDKDQLKQYQANKADLEAKRLAKAKKKNK